jgi:hypothetical protein
VPAIVTDDVDVIEAQLRAELRPPWVLYNKRFTPPEAALMMLTLQQIFDPDAYLAQGYADNYRLGPPRRLKQLAMDVTGMGRANVAKLASALRMYLVKPADTRKVFEDPRWVQDPNVQRFVVATGGRSPRRDDHEYNQMRMELGEKLTPAVTARLILNATTHHLNSLVVASSGINALHPYIEPQEVKAWLGPINNGIRELRRIRRMLQERGAREK